MVGLLGAPDVEVVGLHVGDHGGVRRIHQERPVALVGSAGVCEPEPPECGIGDVERSTVATPEAGHALRDLPANPVEEPSR